MSANKITEDQGLSASISYSYPAEHWKELRRFVEGEEMDPKRLFRLADDRWEAWRYSERGRPSNATDYRYNFGQLRSYLKPYVKLYCYNDLMGRGGLQRGVATLPYSIKRADRFIIDHKIRTLGELAIPGVFEELWDAQISAPPGGGRWPGWPPQSAVVSQMKSRPFWQEMSARYGVPRIMPPVARYKQSTPAEIGKDESKIIPEHVIRQLANRLALHRDNIVRLNPYHHLRACVLLLVICLGRRVEEVLGAFRGAGPDGPFKRYPCRRQGETEPSAGLWFQFRPNKEGPSDLVYVSPEWEDLALYCVRQLVYYSDQVRDFAVPEERNLLILTSTWNWTSGPEAVEAMAPAHDHDFTLSGGQHGGRRRPRSPQAKNRSTGLSYYTFADWLNGYTSHGVERRQGIFEKWNITADGSPNGSAYRLKTGQPRHTRQSELARCSQVPLHARQRDLNHSNPGMQMYYQHVLNEENEELMSAVSKSPLLGHDMEWLTELIGAGISGEHNDQSPYRTGLVQVSTSRWRKLVESNRLYFESNSVEKGVCDATRGPAACDQYSPVKKALDYGYGSKPDKAPVDVSLEGEVTEQGSRSDNERQVTPAKRERSLIGESTDREGGLGGAESITSNSARLVERLRKRAEQIREEKI